VLLGLLAGDRRLHVQSVDDPVAKVWIRNPGGAIRRNDRIVVRPAVSGRLARVFGSVNVLPTNSVEAIANGLESHAPGSAGKLSRPATVKLLTFSWASAAHRWLKSAVDMRGF